MSAKDDPFDFEEADSDATDDKSSTEPAISKEQFDKLAEENNQLKAQVNAAKERQARVQAPEVDRGEELQGSLDELQEQYDEAIISQDRKKAAELRAQIRRTNDELLEYRLEKKSAEQAANQSAQIALNRVLDRLEVQYPVIDRNSESFNQNTYNELSEMTRAFAVAGLPADQALTKAAAYVLKSEASPASTRTSDARNRNLNALNAQPSSMSGAMSKSVTDNKFDVSRLTPDNIDTLKTKNPDLFATLRGDNWTPPNP